VTDGQGNSRRSATDIHLNSQSEDQRARRMTGLCGPLIGYDRHDVDAAAGRGIRSAIMASMAPMS
jgi:hypothetical protein